MADKLNEFLTKHNLNPDMLDMEKLVSFIMDEMRKGLNNEKSSLPMIQSYCKPATTVKAGEKVIVIDAGGTNLRTCLVSFDNKLQATIEDFNKCKMPGIDKEVSAKEFFSVFADQTERLIDKADKIGFCFSYATKILPNHDGVPLMFSKEIKAPEVIGKHLGEELLAEHSRRGHDVSKKKIIILNDTVTTLLAGFTKTEELGCEGCIGFILGTGTNIAHIENGSIINEESGNLQLTLGDLDEEFLASTKNPNIYHFEKMISGAYLGPASLFVVRRAKEEGLFTENFVVPEELNTIQMSNYLEGKEDTNLITVNEQDRNTLTILLTSFIKRAAKLAASALCAATLRTDFGKEKPILINADGSTFYLTFILAESTYEYVDSFLAGKGRKAKFVKIENSPTLGSAIGALSL